MKDCRGIPMINDLVKNYIAPLLAENEFIRKRHVWNKHKRDVIHVIAIQKSQWNTKDKCTFTLNIGIWLKPLWEILQNKTAPSFIHPEDCFPEYRVGELLEWDKPAKDLWWTLDQNTDAASVGTEIKNVLQKNCLPFLNKCNSLQDVLYFAIRKNKSLHPYGKLAIATLNHLNGKYDIAEEILTEMESNKKLEAWREKIQKVRERLLSNGF
jgi:hypothetical protein